MIIATIVIATIIAINLSFRADDIAIEKSSFHVRGDYLLNITADE